MSFDADIENQSVEKITLVKISPRVRVTGWALHSGSVYVADFPYGIPSRMWAKAPIAFLLDEFEVFFSPNLADIALYGAFYDHTLKKIYINSTDPDAFPDPGVTVSVNIMVASSNQFGPVNAGTVFFPKPNEAHEAEWVGALLEAPFPIDGSTDNIFGYLPISQGAIRIANDGWLNEKLGGDYAWKDADIVAYLLTGKNMEEAIANEGFRQIFLGYVTELEDSDGVVTIQCSDYLSSLEKTIVTNGRTYSTFDTPTLDPAANGFPIRDVYGLVDSFRPVNLALGGVATFNNRWWGCIFSSSYEAPGYLELVVDHTQANTATRTYFTTTPKINNGDSMQFPDNAGVAATAIVVNYASKYVDHTSITRTVAAGNRMRRLFIGSVTIVDRDKNSYLLRAGDHYDEYILGNICGFRLKDNVEAIAGMANSPFDPSQDQIVCRVYGQRTEYLYYGGGTVLSPTNYGGTNSRAAALIYRLLLDAGIPLYLIDPVTWEAAGADSHAMGYAIPASHSSAVETRTYQDLISELLSADLKNIGLINGPSGEILIGLSKIAPVSGPTDLTISAKDFRAFSYKDDFRDIYYQAEVTHHVPDFDTSPGFYDLNSYLQETIARWANERVYHLYRTNKIYQVTTKHTNLDEAVEFAKRISYIVSTRRRLYRLQLPQQFIDECFVGKSFTIQRDLLPGFELEQGVEQSIVAVAVEVEKNIENVSITLDDRKGVQDNEGSW